jgi:hypothetical protein
VKAACAKHLFVKVLANPHRVVVHGYHETMTALGYDVRDVLTDDGALAVGEQVHEFRHQMIVTANERGEL